MLFIGMRDVNRLVAAFLDDNYYCPPPEVIQIELRRGIHAHFNLIHHNTGLKADCYLYTGDPLHQWAVSAVRTIQIDERRTIRLAPPEYVILRKLEFYAQGSSDKHLRDVRAILEMNPEQIDFDFLEKEIAERRLTQAYQKLNLTVL